MGVEARCRPSKSAAHCRHMKRQPFLCNGCPCRGRCHCHRCRHLHCCCHHHCCRNCPSPLLLPSTIDILVMINHHHHHLCCVAIRHRCRSCPCRRPLPSLSPSAIAVAIALGHHHYHAIGHFQELLPWHVKNCIQPIEAKNAYLFLFCWDSGGCIDQSRITDQVLSGDG